MAIGRMGARGRGRSGARVVYNRANLTSRQLAGARHCAFAHAVRSLLRLLALRRRRARRQGAGRRRAERQPEGRGHAADSGGARRQGRAVHRVQAGDARVGWHPRSASSSSRARAGNTTQLHRVAAPGAALVATDRLRRAGALRRVVARRRRTRWSSRATPAATSSSSSIGSTRARRAPVLLTDAARKHESARRHARARPRARRLDRRRQDRPRENPTLDLALRRSAATRRSRARSRRCRAPAGAISRSRSTTGGSR